MYFFTLILFIYIFIFAKVFSKKFRRLNIDKKTNYYE